MFENKKYYSMLRQSVSRCVKKKKQKYNIKLPGIFFSIFCFFFRFRYSCFPKFTFENEKQKQYTFRFSRQTKSISVLFDDTYVLFYFFFVYYLKK
jgi:hypothetical protein